MRWGPSLCQQRGSIRTGWTHQCAHHTPHPHDRKGRPLRGVEGGSPSLGAKQVAQDRLGFEEVRCSGAVGSCGQVNHLLPYVMAALETVDQGSNNGLVLQGVYQGGVRRGAE